MGICPIVSCVHRDTYAGILHFIHDLLCFFDSERNIIIKVDFTDRTDHVKQMFLCKALVLYAGINIHCGTKCNTDHVGYENSAFDDEMISVLRGSNTFKETLHHIHAHKNPWIGIILLCKTFYASF